MVAISHRPHARSLRPMVAVSPRTPHKPSGQISCQQKRLLTSFTILLLSLPLALHLTHTDCYDVEIWENRVRVFYGTEKREGERLKLYTGDISPYSSDRVSDL